MSDIHRLLPELLAEIAAALGARAALALAQSFGGSWVYVPRAPGPTHPLTRALGPEGAAWLASVYAGDYLIVPRASAYLRAARDAEIGERFDAGASARRLAWAYRLTERHVWRILSQRASGADPQTSLL